MEALSFFQAWSVDLISFIVSEVELRGSIFKVENTDISFILDHTYKGS